LVSLILAYLNYYKLFKTVFIECNICCIRYKRNFNLLKITQALDKTLVVKSKISSSWASFAVESKFIISSLPEREGAEQFMGKALIACLAALSPI
jgi:hypothetical protein